MGFSEILLLIGLTAAFGAVGAGIWLFMRRKNASQENRQEAVGPEAVPDALLAESREAQGAEQTITRSRPGETVDAEFVEQGNTPKLDDPVVGEPRVALDAASVPALPAPADAHEIAGLLTVFLGISPEQGVEVAKHLATIDVRDRLMATTIQRNTPAALALPSSDGVTQESALTLGRDAARAQMWAAEAVRDDRRPPLRGLNPELRGRIAMALAALMGVLESNSPEPDEVRGRLADLLTPLHEAVTTVLKNHVRAAGATTPQAEAPVGPVGAADSNLAVLPAVPAIVRGAARS